MSVVLNASIIWCSSRCPWNQSSRQIPASLHRWRYRFGPIFALPHFCPCPCCVLPRRPALHHHCLWDRNVAKQKFPQVFIDG